MMQLLVLIFTVIVLSKIYRNICLAKTNEDESLCKPAHASEALMMRLPTRPLWGPRSSASKTGNRR